MTRFFVFLQTNAAFATPLAPPTPATPHLALEQKEWKKYNTTGRAKPISKWDLLSLSFSHWWYYIMVYEKLHWVLSLGIDIMGILRRLAFIEMNYFGGGAERRANLFKSKCGRTEGDEILCCAQDFKYTHKHIILSILLDMIQTHTIVEFELFCLADRARTRGQCCHLGKRN